MYRYFFALLLLLPVSFAYADIFAPFRDEEGNTKWQYVANFSSGVLIILLTLAAIVLFIVWRRARSYNHQLEEIRAHLEERVKERTARLEQEVAEHVVTTGRLQASEAYIQNILSSMPLVLVGLDREGTITQWNPRAEQLSGIKAENAIGRNLWAIYPDITLKANHIEEALQKNEPLTLRYSQPGSYYMDITVYPLENYSEPGVVVLVDDVTRRVIAENMLIQHDRLASMGELATTMASDINKPLQAILFDLRSFQSQLKKITFLQEDNRQKQEVEHLHQLLQNAAEHGREVESVIQNLLEFARGRTTAPAQASVIDIIEHSIDLAGEVLALPNAIPFSDVHIERHFEDNLPKVPCYITELQQALLSILRYSLGALSEKATQNREGFVPTLKLYVSRSYDALSLRIQHNGTGLSSEEQMCLFEPYPHNAENEMASSAGPEKRLSFAFYVITQQHRGHMAVTSDPEVGTTFHIQLELS